MQLDGPCRKYDPELFFPVGTTGPAILQAEEAKAICRTCPVQTECLQWALVVGAEGVWGGTTTEERRTMRRPSAQVA